MQPLLSPRPHLSHGMLYITADSLHTLLLSQRQPARNARKDIGVSQDFDCFLWRHGRANGLHWNDWLVDGRGFHDFYWSR